MSGGFQYRKYSCLGDWVGAGGTCPCSVRPHVWQGAGAGRGSRAGGGGPCTVRSHVYGAGRDQGV